MSGPGSKGGDEGSERRVGRRAVRVDKGPAGALPVREDENADRGVSGDDVVADALERARGPRGGCAFAVDGNALSVMSADAEGADVGIEADGFSFEGPGEGPVENKVLRDTRDHPSLAEKPDAVRGAERQIEVVG